VAFVFSVADEYSQLAAAGWSLVYSNLFLLFMKSKHMQLMNCDFIGELKTQLEYQSE